MATAAPPPLKETAPARWFGPVRRIVLLAIAAVLTVCIVFAFLTRDAMQELSFLKQTNKPGVHADTQKTIVDTSPWQTAQALAPLAR